MAGTPGAEGGAEFKPPPRPPGLQGALLLQYGALVAAVSFFVVAAECMRFDVPDGKFRKKDGTMISIEAFDPVELGPFPKCHPHHGEYEQVGESGNRTWVKVADAPKAGPFPPGHPENEAFLAKRDVEAKRQAREEAFTWKGWQPTCHLLAMATIVVFLGSKHAVWLFTEQGQEGEAAPEAPSLLKKEDAYWFPVMGSVLLFTLFVVYKYLGFNWIKFMVSCYIVMMCVLSFGANIGSAMDVIKGKMSKPLFQVPLIGLDVMLFDIIGSLVGAVLGWQYYMTRNWIINNIFGLSFSILGLKKVATSNFKTGGIMMMGLFFYDIFWVFGSKSVFGSNVMVTVARGVEAPIKLMFPRSVNGCGNFEFSMLGLGDIVVPGIYIAFMAKWDAVVQGSKKASSFVYLTTSMVAYALSLLTTVAVMLLFNAAQPALLYIVPYVMLASAGLAFARGEFWDLMAYEIPDAEDAKQAKEDKDK